MGSTLSKCKTEESKVLDVLVITRNLPPLVGGMERLLYNLTLGIAEYANVTVIGPEGCGNYLPSTIRVFECSNKLAGFLSTSTLRALRVVRRETFDFVIGGSGLIAPLLWLLKSLFQCRTIVLVHGLDIVVNNWLYQNVFVPALGRSDHIVANSQNTRRLAIEKGCPPTRTTVIHPGTHIPDQPDESRKLEFLERHQIPYKQFMIFVGRITRRKGLAQFIRNSLSAILKECPYSGLVVVGGNPNDSLNCRGDMTDVITAVKETGLAAQVMFLGQIDDRDLETAFSCAAVHVYPLIDTPGDVEGFGMVAVESASLGTPTVAFNVGGVTDAISEDGGRLITPYDYAELTRCISHYIRDNEDDQRKILKHAATYDWKNFNRRFRSLLV